MCNILLTKNNTDMFEIEKFYEVFQPLAPTAEQNMHPAEKTFLCMQMVSCIIDHAVNVGLKDLLGVGYGSKIEQENETSWCDVNELCRRHPELRKSNVVSRKWRIENGFPSKGGYKCRQMYYDPDVIEWINQHLRGKKC